MATNDYLYTHGAQRMTTLLNNTDVIRNCCRVHSDDPLRRKCNIVFSFLEESNQHPVKEELDNILKLKEVIISQMNREKAEKPLKLGNSRFITKSLCLRLGGMCPSVASPFFFCSNFT